MAEPSPEPELPVVDVLPALIDALRANQRVVLQAPPGAGKTTLVPLALLNALPKGRILMLEPRRIAARTAAERMAALLGEPVGHRVGYRMRGATKVSRDTRIEVITQGLLTRMIQRDPMLADVSALIFDEFHERALDADLGLALSLDLCTAFRPDLWLLVMSATLDAAPVAALIDAPVVTAEGRQFPIEMTYLDRPLPEKRGPAFVHAVAAAILRALDETDGDILVFLPGEAEIHRTASALGAISDVEVAPLFGAMSLDRQRAALGHTENRRVVMATAIAETSLTVPGVSTVVDAGLARRLRHDPRSGMARLVTEPVSRAEADQRAGRAGRLRAGRAYRLWTRGAHGALPEHPPAEIEIGDLAPLALELAQWGTDPAGLAFLTPPRPGPYESASTLLEDLGAIDGRSVTPHGAAMSELPLHPRLAHMVMRGVAFGQAEDAATLAALLELRDPLRTVGADLELRLKAFETRQLDKPVAGAVKDNRRQILRRLKDLPSDTATTPGNMPETRTPRLSPGALLSLAYPDRIARLRAPSDPTRYLLSGGRGAVLDADDALAGSIWLVVADLDGTGRDARIRRAARIAQDEIETLHGDRTFETSTCEWDRRTKQVSPRIQRCLGAVAIESRVWSDAPDEAVIDALIDGIRDTGLECLPWRGPPARYLARLRFGLQSGLSLPDVSDAALAETMQVWLAPFLTGRRRLSDLAGIDLMAALRALPDWEEQRALDDHAPARFTAPTGTTVAIDYDEASPSIAIRLQELFGLRSHPVIGANATPLRVVLLSPAGRPVQTTMDLPGFWESSYADVRRDMRGRYPRHSWPEDPITAEPTHRAKPRR